MKDKLYFLQKVLKYGLPNKSSISLYEVGFSDRHLSIELLKHIANANDILFIRDVREMLENNHTAQNYIRTNYPEYFVEKLNQIMK